MSLVDVACSMEGMSCFFFGIRFTANFTCTSFTR
ncbi:unnamed protein product [Ixodes persulcatus]